ncbi:MAG: hypothetical protein U1E65_36290 [Myxococcota bacterium]
MSTPDDALRALLAKTPPPPRLTVDPEDVLSLGEEMLSSRAQVLEPLKDTRLSGADPRLLEELMELDRRWEAALNRARFQLGERARGAGRLGNYPK